MFKQSVGILRFSVATALKFFFFVELKQIQIKTQNGIVGGVHVCLLRYVQFVAHVYSFRFT